MNVFLISDLEVPLLKMGVEILRVRRSYNSLQVVGRLNGKIYTWVESGECYIGKLRVPGLDLFKEGER